MQLFLLYLLPSFLLSDCSRAVQVQNMHLPMKSKVTILFKQRRIINFQNSLASINVTAVRPP
jgi:hypothetical protein